MNLNNILRKIAVILEQKQNALFSYDINRQKNYIEELGIPKDDIERSYFQYKCQMQFNGKGMTFFLNFISFPLVILYWIKFSKKIKTDNFEKRNAVFFRDGKPKNILPKSLKNKYKYIESNPIEGIVLTTKDKKFIKEIIYRFLFSWHFILKCLIKIGKYSFTIERYSPEAIIVCAEYSFTSSVLTEYCKQKKIKHINIMHGEKMYYMRDSFFRFDECYVWDEYYQKMLISLKAEKRQFVIEVPSSLKFEKEATKIKIYDYTYYLGEESEEVLKKISKVLERLYLCGKKISLRPHPRYSNIKTIKKIFSFINIEDVKVISIEQSLLQTGAAISLYSTVLNQALCNSIPIIIDDITNIKNFKKLKELGYICLYKEHRLLSEILEEKYDRNNCKKNKKNFLY